MTDKNRKLKDINLLPSQTRWKKPQSGLYAGLEEEPDSLQELIQKAIDEGDLNVNSSSETQSDWAETDDTKSSFIKNKPTSLSTNNNLGNADQILTSNRIVEGNGKTLSFNNMPQFTIDVSNINFYASTGLNSSTLGLDSNTAFLGVSNGNLTISRIGTSPQTKLSLISDTIEFQLPNYTDSTKKFIKKLDNQGRVEYSSISIKDLSDVDSSATPTQGNVLTWTGTKYAPVAPSSGGSTSVTNAQLLNSQPPSYYLDYANFTGTPPIPGQINYSLTEQNTNLKWVDNKTIYQVTVIIASNQVGYDLSLASIIGGTIDNIVDIQGVFTPSNPALVYPIQGQGTWGSNLYINKANKSINSYVEGNITIRYTKQ